MAGWHFMLQYAVLGIISYTIYKNADHMTGKELQEQNSGAAIIDQAFNYTAQHLSEPINIGNLVNSIGTSRTTLNRVFKDIAQVLPMYSTIAAKLKSIAGGTENYDTDETKLFDKTLVHFTSLTLANASHDRVMWYEDSKGQRVYVPYYDTDGLRNYLHESR